MLLDSLKDGDTCAARTHCQERPNVRLASTGPYTLLSYVRGIVVSRRWKLILRVEECLKRIRIFKTSETQKNGYYGKIMFH